jgi:type IV secretion system protein VirB10
MSVTVHPLPLSPILIQPDPRADMSQTALAEAAHNGFPVVATARRGRDRGGLVGAMGVALALGAVTFVSLNQGADHPSAPRPATGSPILPPQAAPVRPAVATGVPAPTPAQQAVLSRPPAPADVQVQLGGAPVMVYDTSIPDPVQAAPSRAGAPLGSGAGGPNGAPQQLNLTESEAFGFRVGNSGVETASASRLADPTNTVTQGTMIPAVLETAIDSDLPGYVRAVVSLDVRSFDGKRILIPRSSRLIGQYKSGLAVGQTRAYVMWTRLLRPDGVTVALASPSVEFDGKSGLSGQVDNHFFKRFGAASMLSVLGGIGAVASGTAGILISSGSSGAASAAAQRDAQIPPTVRVPQGQPIRVFTARDLDFSTVAP